MSKLLVSSFLVTATAIAAVLVAPVTTAQTQPTPPPAHTGPLFQSSAQCMTCHNGLTTAGGEDVSFGTMWRASMMAHAARDPYWQAGVRREVTDHPQRAGGDRERMLPLPHADGARGDPASWRAAVRLRQHSIGEPGRRHRSPRRRGRLLCVVPPDYERRARLEGQLHRRLRHRDGAAGDKAVRCSGPTRWSLARGRSCDRPRACSPPRPRISSGPRSVPRATRSTPTR